MSWNLPDGVHNPVAPPKQGSRHRVSRTWNGHRSCCVARLSLQSLW